MRKSLEILQANTLELSQIVRQALETNPVLEDVSESISLDAELPRPEADHLRRAADTDDDWRERQIHQQRGQGWTADDEAARNHFHESIVAPVTLQQHLALQLATSGVDDPTRTAAQLLIGNLDERGFFDAPPEELGARHGIPRPALRAAVELLQSFDPPGIAATSLRESLLLQLAHAGEKDSIESRIVADHLEDLARKHYPLIARALGTTVERIAEAAARIARLNPNPGGDFNPAGNPFVRPDVIIEKDTDGSFRARLTNDYVPQLRISDFYKDLLAKSGSDQAARAYLRDQIRDGRTLLRSLSLRQETIQAIAERIIDRQQEFLRRGPRHLRPLTMNEVADELGLHATTISRAVAGKHVLTPHGLMEMRAFFATGYQSTDGTEVSNAAVREAIQQVVAREDPAKPLSDDAITTALKAQGLTVARRTVAKYREQLNILPSHLRKSFAG